MTAEWKRAAPFRLYLQKQKPSHVSYIKFKTSYRIMKKKSKVIFFHNLYIISHKSFVIFSFFKKKTLFLCKQDSLCCNIHELWRNTEIHQAQYDVKMQSIKCFLRHKYKSCHVFTNNKKIKINEQKKKEIHACIFNA